MTSYTKLARFMAEKHHPILRKYQHLAVRDLLYLQAEICHLESMYEEVARKDAIASDERRDYNRDWEELQSSRTRGFGGEQWALAMELRVKLREYCKSCFTRVAVSDPRSTSYVAGALLMLCR